MKFINKKLSFLIFIPILFGFFISIYSWDGVVYFFDRANSRVPADNTSFFSVKNLKSRINGNSNEKIISEQTIVSRTNNSITLNLKNFYSSDKRTSVCSVYDSVELSFVALNVAVSGEPPTITVNAPCTEDISNAEYISTITIPLSEIKNISPSTKEPYLFETLKFNFTNIEDEWPIDFRLKQVIYSNKKNSQSLAIDVFSRKPSIEFQL